jgi:WD40 repeat protein
VIAGFKTTLSGESTEPYSWDATGTPTAMSYPLDLTTREAISLSGNGSVAFISTDATNQLVRYNGLSSAPVPISTNGFLNPVISFTTTTGNFAVGYTDTNPIIWDATNGLRSLNLVLSNAGINLTSWALTDVAGISDNGQTIAGYGTFNGVDQGWVATIPEPSAYGLMGAGALLAGTFLRRRTKPTLKVMA